MYKFQLFVHFPVVVFCLFVVINAFIVVPGKECTVVPYLFANFLGVNMSTCNAVFFSCIFKMRARAGPVNPGTLDVEVPFSLVRAALS